MDVLLAPHNDDETLFAAYTLMRRRPHVVVCTRAAGSYYARERETQEAVYRLTGAETYEQWTYDAGDPRWKWMAGSIRTLADEYEHVWAPAPLGETNGHEPGTNPPPGWGVLQHDRIGELAAEAFGPERTRHYCLYTRWHGRDQRGTEIEPTAQEIARKLDALGQYESQMRDPSTRPWFYEQLDMREWVL